jgi:hypothetical protein
LKIRREPFSFFASGSHSAVVRAMRLTPCLFRLSAACLTIALATLEYFTPVRAKGHATRDSRPSACPAASCSSAGMKCSSRVGEWGEWEYVGA